MIPVDVCGTKCWCLIIYITKNAISPTYRSDLETLLRLFQELFLQYAQNYACFLRITFQK